MAKRKRDAVDGAAPTTTGAVKSRKEKTTSTPQQTSPPPTKSKAKGIRFESASVAKNTPANGDNIDTSSPAITAQREDVTTIQIVTGSYERVLHGFTARIPRKTKAAPLANKSKQAADEDDEEEGPKAEFADTFLFNAHSSAIRSLAISPPSDSADQKTQKVILASGGTDERINLYNVSTVPPQSSKSKPKLPTLSSTSIIENPKNRELGALLHHSSSITQLYFPSRSKLLSAAEDNTIAISRTRDWTVLSTIKAPIPKAVGRPSGDTAGPGEVPTGVNDFAVHPSMKLMVSVGKGERCMRLWNLVTGKKAGVLNFSRDLLEQAGVGKFGLSEGQKVEWDAEGDDFVVGFERGVLVFGIDCKPKARILPSPRTKIHQIRYLPASINPHIVALSTEDGRVLFYDTQNPVPSESTETKKEDPIPTCTLVAQLGGPAMGISSRVKDFEILVHHVEEGTSATDFYVIAASSDGTVRVWSLDVSELSSKNAPHSGKAKNKSEQATARSDFTANQVGQLIGSYSNGLRIMCLKAFIMTGSSGEVEEEEEEEKLEDQESDSDSSNSEDDD